MVNRKKLRYGWTAAIYRRDLCMYISVDFPWVTFWNQPRAELYLKLENVWKMWILGLQLSAPLPKGNFADPPMGRPSQKSAKLACTILFIEVLPGPICIMCLPLLRDLEFRNSPRQFTCTLKRAPQSSIDLPWLHVWKVGFKVRLGSINQSCRTGLPAYNDILGNS